MRRIARVRLGLNSSTRRLHMVSASCLIPDQEKVIRGGEDAYFIAKDALGVADGVGGWIRSGVNPAIFARGMMNTSATMIQQNPEYYSDLRGLLHDVYSKVAPTSKGGCTALLASLTGSQLSVLNLGDSVLIVLSGKDASIKYRSKTQQHYFNCPFQLAAPKPSDLAKDASLDQVEVEQGDIVIAGTDGCFDNLFEHEIVDLVKKSWSSEQPLDYMAGVIASEALRLSLDVVRESPFTVESKKQRILGGKPDDITVIVSQVIA